MLFRSKKAPQVLPDLHRPQQKSDHSKTRRKRQTWPPTMLFAMRTMAPEKIMEAIKHDCEITTFEYVMTEMNFFCYLFKFVVICSWHRDVRGTYYSCKLVGANKSRKRTLKLALLPTCIHVPYPERTPIIIFWLV